MTIKAGDKMPAGAFKTPGPEGPQQISTEQLFAGKTVVLFSVPAPSRRPATHGTCRASSSTQTTSRPRVSTPSPAWR